MIASVADSGKLAKAAHKIGYKVLSVSTTAEKGEPFVTERFVIEGRRYSPDRLERLLKDARDQGAKEIVACQ